jgi:hypothetical protein
VGQSYFLRSFRFARCQQWDSDESSPTRRQTLVGEGAFDTPVNALAADAPRGARPVHITRMEFAPVTLSDDSLYKNPSAYEGRLSARLHDETRLVSAELTVWLPVSVFENLWAAAAGGDLEVRCLVRMSEREGTEPLKLNASDEYAAAQLMVFSLHTVRSLSANPAALFKRRALQLEDAMQGLHFPRMMNNQVPRICHELASGLAMVDDEATRLERLQSVIELIADARGAFKMPLTGTGEQYNDNAYGLDKAAFETFIQQFDSKRQDELKTSYNQLWKHFTLVDTVRLGEVAAGPVPAGFKCFQEDLDPVAEKYMSLGVRSPTLEVLLLDALTFGEGLGFAQQILSQKKLLGYVIATPIEATNPWAKARSDTVQSFWNAAAELFKLALTYGFALFLTQENPVATWVVVTGITMTRWLRKAFFWRELNPKVKLNEILGKLSSVSETFKRADFNAAGVRSHIHALTLEGVVYSPWVLNILDRRVAADNSNPG